MADPLVAEAGYRTIAARLRGVTLNTVVSTWLTIPDPTDTAVEQWVRIMAPVLDASQHRIGVATSAYLASVAPPGKQEPVPVPAETMASAELRGVPADELLHRVPEQMWTSLGNGDTPDHARQISATRATALVLTGLQLAHTHASRRFMKAHRVKRFSRKTRAGACDLCQLSASQVFNSDHLMPIHDGCACTVVPVWGDDNLPGESSAADEAYQDEVTVHEHGELGPVLTHQDHSFRGPAAVP